MRGCFNLSTCHIRRISKTREYNLDTKEICNLCIWKGSENTNRIIKGGEKKENPIPFISYGLRSPYRVWGKNLDILFCLYDYGALTVREIAEKTGISYDTVKHNCKRSYKRGLLEPKPRWGYALTGLAKDILNFHLKFPINNNNNKGQIRDKQGTNKGQLEAVELI